MFCNILFIGDVMGKPGRRAIKQFLPALRDEYNLDCVIANVENVAGGKGIEMEKILELENAGVDVFTSGNHVWDKPDVMKCFEAEGHRHELVVGLDTSGPFDNDTVDAGAAAE